MVSPGPQVPNRKPLPAIAPIAPIAIIITSAVIVLGAFAWLTQNDQADHVLPNELPPHAPHHARALGPLSPSRLGSLMDLDQDQDQGQSHSKSPPREPAEAIDAFDPPSLTDAPSYFARSSAEWQGMRVDMKQRQRCTKGVSCADSLVCWSDGYCGPCSERDPCPSGARCVLDHCVPLSKSACTMASECPSNGRCVLYFAGENMTLSSRCAGKGGTPDTVQDENSPSPPSKPKTKTNARLDQSPATPIDRDMPIHKSTSQPASNSDLRADQFLHHLRAEATSP